MYYQNLGNGRHVKETFIQRFSIIEKMMGNEIQNHDTDAYLLIVDYAPPI